MSKKICCVYQISNLRTGRKYVGGTNHYFHRMQQHLHILRKNEHYSKLLQDDYNKYGESYVVFSVLEDANIYNLREKEQKWLDELHPEYNTNRDAITPNPEIVQSIPVREKISISVKKLWDDPSYRSRCAVPRKWKDGVPNRKGVKLSDETKEKIRQAALGEKNPNYGKPRTEETKEKISRSNYRTYIGAVSPDGVVYAPIVGMREFCKQHNLCESSMVALMRHRIDKHKGWIRYEP